MQSERSKEGLGRRKSHLAFQISTPRASSSIVISWRSRDHRRSHGRARFVRSLHPERGGEGARGQPGEEGI